MHKYQTLCTVQHLEKIKPSNSERKLIKQKNKLVKLQAFARRLDRRISLERQIIENKNMFEEIEKEIEEYEKKAQITKQEIIKNRLQKMEEKRKKRIEEDKNTSKQVIKVLSKEKKKQLILNKILQKNKQEYDYCYEKALAQRKKLRNPINFEQIEDHQGHFINKKRKNSSSRYLGDPNDQSIKENSSRRTSRKMARSVVDQYFETRRKEQNRILQLKEIMKKKREYGDRVEKQFVHNRVRTEVSQSFREQQIADKKEREIKERNRILKQMKKPGLPFETENQDKAEKNQIKMIKNSNLSTQEKLKKLNSLCIAYENKLKLKGKQEHLNRISQINLAKAQIILGKSHKNMS